MGVPGDRKYTDEHEWARDEGDGTVTVGITEHAQDQLGDIVFFDPPEVGRAVDIHEDVAIVESVKAVSDVYSPVTGEVIAVNDMLHDQPELINQRPYEDGWMMRIEMSDTSELDDLMDSDAYDELTLG